MNCQICGSDNVILFPDEDGDLSIYYCKGCGKITKTKEDK